MSDRYNNTLHRIELPTIFGMKTVNSYLIKEPEVTLIDCGEDTSASYAALVSGLKEHGLTITDVDRVIITHAHVDHIGMLKRLAEESGARVEVSDLVLPWAVDTKRMWDTRTEVYQGMVKHFIPGYMHEGFLSTYSGFASQMEEIWPSASPDYVTTFEPEGEIVIGGEVWKTLYVPGHAYTQSCFYNEKTNELISADMLLRISPTPVLEGVQGSSSERDKSILIMLDSYKRIHSLPLSTVYPGHYEIFTDGHDKIVAQVARIHQRKQECYQLIKGGTNSVMELFVAMYKSIANMPGFYMILGYVDLLMDEGLIEEREEDGYYRLYAV